MSEHDEDEDHGDHEGGGHGEPWLVSYADLMTLLFGFFVIMYSFAVAKLDDDEAMVKMRKEVATYFGGEFVTPLSKEAAEFKKQVGGLIPKRNIDTKLSPEGLEVTFQSQSLFRSGSANLMPEARRAIGMLIDLIKKRKGTNFKVTVEGHTDDIPIRTRRFPSNWELSGARAATVIRIFEARGFPAKNLMAIGFGESKPLKPNRSKKGRAIRSNQMVNRRVKIRIMGIEEAPKAAATKVEKSVPQASIDKTKLKKTKTKPKTKRKRKKIKRKKRPEQK